MGFLYQAIKIPNAIGFFINIFAHARFIFVGALTRLGLYKPPPEEEETISRYNSNNYILIFDGSCPSFIPIPIHVVTAAIKNRVPVVQYRDFTTRQRQEKQEDGFFAEEEESCEMKACTICLESIEWEHEVRELCKCSHVFHRECLETWIDEGQVTCPLCRSMMLPPKTNLHTRCDTIEN